MPDWFHDLAQNHGTPRWILRGLKLLVLLLAFGLFYDTNRQLKARLSREPKFREVVRSARFLPVIALALLYVFLSFLPSIARSSSTGARDQHVQTNPDR